MLHGTLPTAGYFYLNCCILSTEDSNLFLSEKRRPTVLSTENSKLLKSVLLFCLLKLINSKFLSSLLGLIYLAVNTIVLSDCYIYILM